MRIKLEPRPNASIYCEGLSSDGRTNRWQFTCTCGYTTKPPTTLYAKQCVTCELCHTEWNVNYNESTIEKAKEAEAAQ